MKGLIHFSCRTIFLTLASVVMLVGLGLTGQSASAGSQHTTQRPKIGVDIATNPEINLNTNKKTQTKAKNQPKPRQ